jgi:DNA-binding CsgD family transcriptional regulator
MTDRNQDPGPLPLLRGRDSECASLDGLLDQVRAGRSAVVVMRGDAGIGKTALLQYLTNQAADFTVTRCVGVESEMELAFAALHDLSGPILAGLEGLIEPQQQALRVALGLAGGERPDPFLVALSALSLFAAAAEERPMLCMVDDAQWLDQASAQILGFVGRRLLAEPIALVFAARSPVPSPDHLAGLPDMRLGGLDEQSARALLTSVIPPWVDESVQTRVIEETHGNPLALLELSAGFSAADLAGGFAIPNAASVSRRVEDQYLARLRAMPLEVQQLVLVAAADPVGDLGLLQRATRTLELGIEAQDLAVDAGLLDIGAGVRFRHPLLRRAAYRAGTAEERRVAHAALAAATDPKVDPDRWAWHRASAASGPDEQVAAELIGSADRAQRRGGAHAAAAFWDRAVRLTPDPGQRALRALAAADAKYAAADFEAAKRLLITADVGPLAEVGHAEVQRMRAQIAFTLNRGADAPSMLLHAAQRLQPLDVDAARQTYLDAMMAGIHAGRLAIGESLAQVALAAKVAPLDPEPLPHPQLLLRGLATCVLDGYRAAAPLLTEALREYRAQPRELDPLCHCYNLVAMELWDADTAFELASGQAKLARASGTLSWLPFALAHLAVLHVHAGELNKTEALVIEAERIDPAMRTADLPYVAPLLAAWRGHAPTAQEAIDKVVADSSRRGEGVMLTYTEYVKAVLHNGLAEYDSATEAAYSAARADEIVVSRWACYELVEAAVRSGHSDRAARACARLSEIGMASQTPWARGVAAHTKALLANGNVAEDLFCEAIELLSQTRVGAYLARTRLCYGEWLRRQNRRVDARVQLRSAFEVFSTMGADAFAERARHELVVTGEKVRKRSEDHSTDLTSQEERIAELARQRLTNPEIGAELFLSARTVEWHLRNIYIKLDISSRRELDAALTRRSRTRIASAPQQPGA